MSLAVFDNFLTFAESALRTRGDWPASLDAAEVESALVNYGVVLLHSHMEQCLREAHKARCSHCTDIELRAFTLSLAGEKTGRIGIDALNQTLGRFSPECRNGFIADVAASGLGTSWASIANLRKSVAHDGKPAALSLADLRIYFEGIRKVLGFYCKRLGLGVDEIASISALIVA